MHASATAIKKKCTNGGGEATKTATTKKNKRRRVEGRKEGREEGEVGYHNKGQKRKSSKT